MKIFICGDSTAASYAPEDAPLTGWDRCWGTMSARMRCGIWPLPEDPANHSCMKAGCRPRRGAWRKVIWS